AGPRCAAYIGRDERIVTVEDTAELRLAQDHVARLEARPPNVQGAGAIDLRALVRNALRMRPDRIVVGEVRGPEALDMLQAMNTGHEGSLSTCHANSPPDALRRLETLVLMGDVALPLAAVREQVRSALDLVVQVARRPGGPARHANCVRRARPPAPGWRGPGASRRPHPGRALVAGVGPRRRGGPAHARPSVGVVDCRPRGQCGRGRRPRRAGSGRGRGRL